MQCERHADTLGMTSEPWRFLTNFQRKVCPRSGSFSFHFLWPFLSHTLEIQRGSPQSLRGSLGLIQLPCWGGTGWRVTAVFLWSRVNAKVTFCLSLLNSALIEIWILGDDFVTLLGWQISWEGATKAHGQQKPRTYRVFSLASFRIWDLGTWIKSPKWGCHSPSLVLNYLWVS